MGLSGPSNSSTILGTLPFFWTNLNNFSYWPGLSFIIQLSLLDKKERRPWGGVTVYRSAAVSGTPPLFFEGCDTSF
jgi:hypothetical protein